MKAPSQSINAPQRTLNHSCLIATSMPALLPVTTGYNSPSQEHATRGEIIAMCHIGTH
jgi:hypothetical protein